MHTYFAASKGYTSLCLTNAAVSSEIKASLLLTMPPTAHLITLQENLQQSGYRVRTAYANAELLAILQKEAFDLLLVYLILPDNATFELCITIRNYSRIPIILLSEQKNLDAMIFGLTVGADAYLAMPFSVPELDLRIQATLRRAGKGWRLPPTDQVSLQLDHNKKVIQLAGREIELTPIEYQLLSYLMRYPGVPITKPQLAEVVWSFANTTDYNFIEVMIWRLRKKIEVDPTQPQYLVTVRGNGYQLNLQPLPLVEN